MKNKEKSDVITYVENPTTIEKKGRSIELFIKYHVVCSLVYLRNERAQGCERRVKQSRPQIHGGSSLVL